ncbi:MAG TPA: ribonuclease P protein component [Lacibacter sp.]|nr:ribonuclease P protein component [Lacibacter sp.]HMO88585.1 ribonuclease P protein component [Lacibacter sp.]HMP86115.1 ribonuclease P protein component [Lacibacter sp.]
MPTTRHTLGSRERIKSRKRMEQLFREGRALQVPPLRASYILLEEPVLQFGVGVGTRHFKKAVDRNRIKRLLREAYRLQKQPLQEALQKTNRGLALFVMYTGRELPDYHRVYEKMTYVLAQLHQQFHEIR